jgi:threonine dehydrogenase-like Zn-dependent dehydrogenase
MRQLTYEETGRYAWREVAEPEITAPEQALVRPLMVACCDLDVAVCHGRVPLPPGYAVGHEGLAEVVAVGDDVKGVRAGDRVVVPRMPSWRDRFVRLGSADGGLRDGTARRP